MTKEQAKEIIWNRCQHTPETAEAIRVLSEERPQGEWILNTDENPECPFCHHSFTYWGNFCGNCGADLGVKKNESSYNI